MPCGARENFSTRLCRISRLPRGKHIAPSMARHIAFSSMKTSRAPIGCFLCSFFNAALPHIAFAERQTYRAEHSEAYRVFIHENISRAAKHKYIFPRRVQIISHFAIQKNSLKTALLYYPFGVCGVLFFLQFALYNLTKNLCRFLSIV